MCGPGDPIAPDWKQTDNNITNTCLGRIDDFARYALPACNKRNKQRDTEPIHDR